VKFKLEMIIFDVDGVLVDVRGSFHRSTIQTVHHFTGKKVSIAGIQKWKSKGGYNDDWKLTTAWLRELGVRITYEEVKKQFMKVYWGEGRPGNVARERWLVPAKTLRRWSRRYELSLFTGRTRRELSHTLPQSQAKTIFRHIVTMDDIDNLKPHPDGLLRILNGRDPSLAIYLGDNVDDAIAARRAGVKFLGVLPRNSHARRLQGPKLRQEGALKILDKASDLDRWLKTNAGKWHTHAD
jgi:HAD superfamily hydrolase (TIGR01548 family)